MTNRRAVQTFCRIMAWLTLIGMAAAILIPVGIWMSPADYGVETWIDGLAAPQIAALSEGQRAAGLSVSLIGALLQAVALWLLRQTFLEGARGEWFSLKAVRSFRRFAWLLLILVFVGIFQATAISVIASADNPPGEHSISIGVGSREMGALFNALLMLFVAQMFAAGREADEENAAFI